MKWKSYKRGRDSYWMWIRVRVGVSVSSHLYSDTDISGTQSQTKLLPSCWRSYLSGGPGVGIHHQITLLRVFCHSVRSQLLLLLQLLLFCCRWSSSFCFSPLNLLLAPKSCPFHSHVFFFLSHPGQILGRPCVREYCEEALMESRHKFKFYYCSYYRCVHRGSGQKKPDTGYRGQTNLYGNMMRGIYTNKHMPIWSSQKAMWIHSTVVVFGSSNKWTELYYLSSYLSLHIL